MNGEAEEKRHWIPASAGMTDSDCCWLFSCQYIFLDFSLRGGRFLSGFRFG